jgi:FKBP-type peptidyl-prolyl cis-trans isomerase FklB
MRIVKNLLAVTIIGTMVSCGNQVKEVKSLENELDSVSYAVGISMSGQLKSNFSEVNKAILSQGIRNGLDSTSMLIDAKDIQKILSGYFQKKQQAQMKEKQAAAAKEAEAKLASQSQTNAKAKASLANQPLRGMRSETPPLRGGAPRGCTRMCIP